jgi:hypothetical protein
MMIHPTKQVPADSASWNELILIIQTKGSMSVGGLRRKSQPALVLIVFAQPF